MSFDLVWPAMQYLDSYKAALNRGWSPDNMRPEAAIDELARIADDPLKFLLEQVDPDGAGPPVIMPDGTTRPRIPGYRRWMWDGEFCGVIGLRWVPGTTELPPHCLGHIGYAVVPWKRRNGYATKALRILIDELRSDPNRMPFVDLTTQPDNEPSQRVITSNGGVFVETFRKPDVHAGAEAFRYRIHLRETT